LSVFAARGVPVDELAQQAPLVRFEVLTLVQTGKSKMRPVLLFGRDFWSRLIEFDRTDRIFTAPAEKLTEDYVTGRCG